MIWIVIGPVICFILLLFVGGAVFVIFKKKYDLSLLHGAQTEQASEAKRQLFALEPRVSFKVESPQSVSELENVTG